MGGRTPMLSAFVGNPELFPLDPTYFRFSLLNSNEKGQ